MAVSIHDPEWDQMKSEFIGILECYHGEQVALEIWDDLVSIMNDYGAVSYT